MEKEGKTLIRRLGITIIIIFIAFFGITYAWYSFTNSNINVAGTTNSWCSSLDVTVTSNKSVTLSPTGTVDSYQDATYSEVTITNNEDMAITIDLSLTDIAIDAALISEYFAYSLIDGTTVVATGNFSTVSTGSYINLVTSVEIPANSSKTYNLYLYVLNDGNCTTEQALAGTCTNGQNDMMNKSFSAVAKATVSSTWCNNYQSGSWLYKIIESKAVMDNISSTNVTASTGIDFSTISSDENGKGVYTLSSTSSNNFPIYYYRGAVEDNNVIFGGFCWKIVRTTDTGGTKMIYNGVPTDGICDNTGTDAMLNNGDSFSFNLSADSLAYLGYMYGTVYASSSNDMSSLTGTSYYYGNSVTYSDGTYTLTDTITSSSWSSIYSGGLNSNHYTCFSTGTTCSQVYYIYNTTSTTAYYLTLVNGEKIEDALEAMLDNNTTSSSIKGDSTTSGSIDYWYYNNLIDYASYIEDTVFCNNRSIYSLGGFDPNGGETDYSQSLLVFAVYESILNGSPSLTCPRDIDKFTVNASNGNGALNYPIGLLTFDEIMLAGGVYSTENTSYYLYSGGQYWALSPFFYINGGSVADAEGTKMGAFGKVINGSIEDANGIRPVISLKYGVEVSGGDGSTDTPYIVGS